MIESRAIIPHQRALNMIYKYMDSKAQEYAAFDPNRAKRLFKLLQPHLKLQSYNIHIIGTNGKGSTGRFITQSIIESNRKVLHFTSPHVFDFRERFYTNSGIVELEELIKAHLYLQQFEFIQEASYFEYATFLALAIGQDCDYLVMEAGIGGEFDSTSVLKYDMTIFTRIGLDHKEMLGNNLESIAKTKLRAAQGVIFTHFQEQETLELLQNLKNIMPKTMQKENHNAPTNIIYLQAKDMQQLALKEYIETYKIPYFLQENLSLAYLALKHIKIPLLKNRLDLAGRFEIISPNIVVDVGHNIMAASATLAAAKNYFNNKQFTLIYNSYKEKEISEILKIFKNDITEIIIFMVENQRIINAAEMQNILESISLPYVFYCPNKRKLDILPKKLIESADILQKNKNYLVFGSFSLVEHFLLWFHKRH